MVVDALSDIFAHKYNYLGFIILMMIGLWAMLAKINLAKKILGMSIFQSAIILFYISISVKRDATLPILEHHGGGEEHGAHAAADATHAAAGAVHNAVNATKEMVHGAVNATGDAMHSALDAASHAGINAADYINPLPHVLMLTAIVVSVATLGVALALAMKIYKEYNTLDEDVILEKIRQ
ncbi:cation:proton antiporter subunit C [Oceanidesulfovibrio marinus]|uniref:NADH-quinone oxidoreductase subunit J n=1 Tax=Oceanidesulfovibrio marinus TaxID=370038 RepID=A0A6P1ZH47_9BACT|nr:cation:proton antiporter subunit C [Oceanidesulfovibrio marinus]QJT07605.1 NADH-quinone oxidoreductase subunit J [Oceanidesulfovibrio marinus]TVM34481.1 NADH-quinone oxidoreductase subunit J [Oceanidesulfovibrio marinus]